MKVFVVNGTSATGSPRAWGRDIAALSHLRFVHRLGNLTVKSSEPAYVGRRYEAFALDLSSYAGARVRTMSEIEFWTTDGHQRLRGATHVYTPEILAEVEGAQAKLAKTRAQPAPDPSQMDVFEALASAASGESLPTSADDEGVAAPVKLAAGWW